MHPQGQREEFDLERQLHSPHTKGLVPPAVDTYNLTGLSSEWDTQVNFCKLPYRKIQDPTH